jgi:hypothetical protein
MNSVRKKIGKKRYAMSRVIVYHERIKLIISDSNGREKYLMLSSISGKLCLCLSKIFTP